MASRESERHIVTRIPFVLSTVRLSAIGPATLPGLLSWPYAVVVGLVALVAFAGFVAAERVERRSAGPAGPK